MGGSSLDIVTKGRTIRLTPRTSTPVDVTIKASLDIGKKGRTIRLTPRTSTPVEVIIKRKSGFP